MDDPSSRDRELYSDNQEAQVFLQGVKGTQRSIDACFSGLKSHNPYSIFVV